MFLYRLEGLLIFTMPIFRIIISVIRKYFEAVIGIGHCKTSQYFTCFFSNLKFTGLNVYMDV